MMQRRTYFGVSAVMVLLVCCLWVVWDNWGRTPVRAEEASRQPTQASAQTTVQTIARGQYLAQVGGCIGCHTQPGQALLSGGRRIDTPYGAVYSSNLTPSRAQGLGQWALQDFQTALRWGRSKDGRLLLPVFPYNHTRLLSDDDVRSLFAWVQSVAPVDRAVAPHELTWPLGTQPVIAVWRSLFFHPIDWRPDAAQSALWNRGAYLVQGLGHCATCHGQRHRLGGFPAVNDLSGGYLSPQGWVAPSLVDPKQTAMARSSVQEVAQLLRAGQNAHASVSGPMAEFVQQSSQYLSEDDALAMATYLKAGLQGAGAEPTLTVGAAASPPTNASAAQNYKDHCASCHGEQGQGKPGIYPGLAGNPAVNLSAPDNLIQMALYGGFGPSTALRPRPYGMPPFLFKLNNEDMAQVLTFVRKSWGNQAPEVTAAQVDRVRAAKY